MNEGTPQIRKSTIYLTEVETLAQDILTNKRVKLQLSNTRNKFQEAYRILQNLEKTWMKFGSLYIKLPAEECRNILKNEFNKVTLDIDDLQETIKQSTIKLRDVEHQQGIEGFTLKPITAAEAKVFHKGFGLS